MTDREKILLALAACLPEKDEDAMIGCTGCPYQCHNAENVLMPLRLMEDIRKRLKKEWKPRIKAKWNITDAWPHRLYCSNCYKTFLIKAEWQAAYNIPTNYCPNCAAEME